MQLHTGVDYFMGLPLDELNEYAEETARIMEEVASRGNKK